MSSVATASAPAATALHLSNGDGERAAAVYAPTHPGLFQVEFQPGAYNSSLVAKRAFKKGDTVATFSHAQPTSTVRYSSVQVGENSHIELHSDLLYCNHSCEPNVHFNVSGATPASWRVEALRDIAPGDALSFFYPSTEWDMSQPFSCTCGHKSCLGRIAGAKHIPSSTLLGGRFAINDHIRRLKTAQANENSKTKA